MSRFLTIPHFDMSTTQPSKIPMSKTTKSGTNKTLKMPIHTKPKLSYIPRPKELPNGSTVNTKRDEKIRGAATVSFMEDKLNSVSSIIAPEQNLISVKENCQDVKVLKVGSGESACVRVPHEEQSITASVTSDDQVLLQTMVKHVHQKITDSNVAIDFLMAPKPDSKLGDCVSRSPFEVAQRESLIRNINAGKSLDMEETDVIPFELDDETFFGGRANIKTTEEPRMSKLQLNSDEMDSIENIPPPDLHDVVSDPKLEDNYLFCKKSTDQIKPEKNYLDSKTFTVLNPLGTLEDEQLPFLVESNEDIKINQTDSSITLKNNIMEVGPLESIENVQCPTLVESNEDLINNNPNISNSMNSSAIEDMQSKNSIKSVYSYSPDADCIENEERCSTHMKTEDIIMTEKISCNTTETTVDKFLQCNTVNTIKNPSITDNIRLIESELLPFMKQNGLITEPPNRKSSDQIFFNRSTAQINQDLRAISKGLNEAATWGSITIYLSSLAVIGAVVLRNYDSYFFTPASDPEPLGWLAWLSSLVGPTS